MPLAIVTFVVIIGVSTTSGGSRGLPTAEPSSDASATAASSESTAPRRSEPSSEPSATPEPTPEPTWQPAPSFEPAPDDDLTLAGRDGVPGRLQCGRRTFDFDDLNNPTGAEDGVGPEFDILRETLPRFWLPTEYGPDPHVREVARDQTGVTFLADLQTERAWETGDYIYVDVDHVGGVWKWAGTGDCAPRAWAPPGFGAATWTWDPAFRKPRPDDRVLHLLVSEFACSSGRSAQGRIGPAYVTFDRFSVRVELVVQSLAGGQDCQAVAPTPARIRLPEPVGDRNLVDMNEHILSGTGG